MFESPIRTENLCNNVMQMSKGRILHWWCQVLGLGSPQSSRHQNFASTNEKEKLSIKTSRLYSMNELFDPKRDLIVAGLCRRSFKCLLNELMTVEWQYKFSLRWRHIVPIGFSTSLRSVNLRVKAVMKFRDKILEGRSRWESRRTKAKATVHRCRDLCRTPAVGFEMT